MACNLVIRDGNSTTESLPIESKVYDFVTLTMTFIPKIAILDFVVTGASAFHKHILFRVDLFADGSQVSDIGPLGPLVLFDLSQTWLVNSPCRVDAWFKISGS